MGKNGFKSIEGQGHSLTLGKVIQISKFKLVFSETSGSLETQFLMKTYERKEMQNYSYKCDHMTKMVAMTIYGKNLSKIFPPGTSKPITLKLGM